ncbi:ATP-binding protein, partial [Dactylosporangium sp. NPDC049742]|uniref:ATP-binding protein n=1 Tax=Dactylosporangium sp. NPDC049742 TaxID=3154737 RepID=UPI0034266E3C
MRDSVRLRAAVALLTATGAVVLGVAGALPGGLATLPLAVAAAVGGTLLGLAAAAIWLPAAVLLLWLLPGSGSGDGTGTAAAGPEPHPVVAVAVVAAAGLLPVLAMRVRRAWTARGERMRIEARAAAAAAERARLAREMHDSLSKTLDAIALGAAALPGTLAEPDRASRLAATLRDGSLDAARDARVLIDELRSNPADAPLSDVVAAIGREWSVTSDVGVILHNADVDAAPEVGIELCWILREALRNVAAHAGAELVAVTLTRAGGEVTLEVRDDGAGFAVPDDLSLLQRAGSHGLVGMQERARLCGGTLTVWSRPGGGSRVTAVVPAEPATPVSPPSRRLRLLVGAAAVALPVALILPFTGVPPFGGAEGMKDQVDGLLARNVQCAATLNGLLTMPERAEVLEKIQLGDVGILLVSPEQFRNMAFRRAISQRQVGAWIFDEAHCLSKWGADFRPDYLYVSRFIKQFTGDGPLAAIGCFTATAKPDVLEDIEQHFKEQLGITFEHFIGTHERTNLHFEVLPCTRSEKRHHTQTLLEEELSASEGGAVIFVSSRKGAEELADFL